MGRRGGGESCEFSRPLNKKVLSKMLPLLVGVALLVSLWSRFSWEQVRLAFAQVGWLMLPLIALSLVWLPCVIALPTLLVRLTGCEQIVADHAPQSHQRSFADGL